MASVQFGVTKINPSNTADVVYDATGAALEGSNLLQVTYQDSSFTAAEGKERLIEALKWVIRKVEKSTWPAS